MMKIRNLLLAVVLVGLVAFVFYRHIQKSRSEILNEWTGRSKCTRTKLDESQLPYGWKRGGQYAGPDPIL
jgi:hypothetical protein